MPEKNPSAKFTRGTLRNKTLIITKAQYFCNVNSRASYEIIIYSKTFKLKDKNLNISSKLKFKFFESPSFCYCFNIGNLNANFEIKTELNKQIVLF